MVKEYKNPKQAVIKAIRSDGKFLTFRKVVTEVRAKLNIDADRDEALSLHAGRVSRSIYGTKSYSPKTIMEAESQDGAYRSRLVEIRVRVDIQMSVLKEAVEATKKHINTEYYEDLNEYKTVDQRRALVDRLVASALDLQAEGEALCNLLDALIKDIDAMGFKLRDLLECLKLLADIKGKVV